MCGVSQAEAFRCDYQYYRRTTTARLIGGFRGDLVIYSFEEIADIDRAQVAAFAVPDRHFAGFGLPTADYEHVGNFLKLGIADLEIDLFAAVIYGRADPRCLKFCGDFVG